MAASTLDPRRDLAAPSASRPAHVRRLAPVAVLALLFGAWWFLGGTFVGALQGDIVGVAVGVGEDASFGQPLSADGGGARLRGVTAQVTPAATIEWSVYQGTGTTGFGTWHGPLAPTWPVVPVDGAPVSQDHQRATWLIATVRASTPGVYRVSHITLAYRSGWRPRNEDSAFVACVLVAPADRSTDELRASDDPLWQEYQACSTGH